MSDKSYPPRRAPNVASPHPKRPYKALLIRAQTPEPSEGTSTGNDATCFQEVEMKPRQNNAARKTPYKALLIRARSPEPADEENNYPREEPKQKRRMPRKNSAPKRIVLEEPEVTQTVARIISEEPEVNQTVAKPCNSVGSKMSSSDKDLDGI